MTTHSKGSYVAYRSKRDAPTNKELARRKLLEEDIDNRLDYLECEVWVLAGYLRSAAFTAFETRCLLRGLE